MKLKRDYELYAVFGYPLSHTLSPFMHEAAFRDKGLKHFYLSIELDLKSFRQSMRSLKRFNLSGFNLTVPYKEVIMQYLHQVSPQAKVVGAVNTVFKRKGKWCGTNTDVDGFLTSLRLDGKFNPRGKHALIFGAGGASRAAIYGLAHSKAESITIANRTSSRAKKVARQFKKLFPKVEFKVISLKQKDITSSLEDADLVVNTTSLGLKPSDKALLKASLIPRVKKNHRIIFYDMIYHRKETPFLKSARLKGHKTVNGLGMLLYQGAKAFEIWTQKKAPISVMKSQLKARLA